MKSKERIRQDIAVDAYLIRAGKCKGLKSKDLKHKQTAGIAEGLGLVEFTEGGGLKKSITPKAGGVS